jgi:hypothetical protein
MLYVKIITHFKRLARPGLGKAVVSAVRGNRYTRWQVGACHRHCIVQVELECVPHSRCAMPKDSTLGLKIRFLCRPWPGPADSSFRGFSPAPRCAGCVDPVGSQLPRPAGLYTCPPRRELEPTNQIAPYHEWSNRNECFARHVRAP